MHYFTNSATNATPSKATLGQRNNKTERQRERERARERKRERERENERENATGRQREGERSSERLKCMQILRLGGKSCVPRVLDACKYCDLVAAAAYEETWMFVNIVMWW